MCKHGNLLFFSDKSKLCTCRLVVFSEEWKVNLYVFNDETMLYIILY